MFKFLLLSIYNKDGMIYTNSYDIERSAEYAHSFGYKRNKGDPDKR